MRKAAVFLSSLAFAAAAACTQAGRKPDSVLATVCESAFDAANEELSLGSARQSSLDTIRQGYGYLEKVFPGEVAALLEKEKPACERARDFSDTERDLKLKLETLAQTAKLLDEKEAYLSELAQSEMMNDPDFRRIALCVLNCGTNKNYKCSEYCSVEQGFIDGLAKNDLFMKLYNTCLPQVGEFSRELERFLPSWSKSLKRDLWPAYHELTLQTQSTRLALHGVRARLREEKFAEKIGSCALPAPRWQLTARTKIDKVKGPGGQGSAFYISAGESEVRAVTAEHIYNDSGTWGRFDPRTLVFSAKGMRKMHASQISRQVQPEEGLYNRDADILQTRVTDKRPVLKLISMEAIPKLGQTFYLAGYPKVKDYHFTVYRCSFYGFSPDKSPQSTATFYVLRCPGVDGHIAGMSGGPLLDESGKVWGLITDHNPFLARVFVSPMSAGPGNEPRMGIQQTFMTDACLGGASLTPKSCQIAP